MIDNFFLATAISGFCARWAGFITVAVRTQDGIEICMLRFIAWVMIGQRGENRCLAGHWTHQPNQWHNAAGKQQNGQQAVHYPICAEASEHYNCNIGALSHWYVSVELNMTLLGPGFFNFKFLDAIVSKIDYVQIPFIINR